MSAEVLARIDAVLDGFASARLGHGAASMYIPAAETALRYSRAEIVRLSEDAERSRSTGERILADALARRVPEPPTEDEREALALRIMQIWTGCDAESAAFYRSEDTGGWRRDLSYAGDLMASPEWRNRPRGPITDEDVAVFKLVWESANSEGDVGNRVRRALTAVEASRA